MLFDLCCRLKYHLDIGSLGRSIEDFFGESVQDIHNPEENPNVKFTFISKDGFLIIQVLDNVLGFDYESDLLHKDYMFEETLVLKVSKNSFSLDLSYNKALEFSLYLADRLSLEMLVTLDYEDEICYHSYNKAGFLWNDNQVLHYFKRDDFPKYFREES